MRNLLLAQAFSGLAVTDAAADTADYRDDPLGIGRSQAAKHPLIDTNRHYQESTDRALLRCYRRCQFSTIVFGRVNPFEVGSDAAMPCCRCDCLPSTRAGTS